MENLSETTETTETTDQTNNGNVEQATTTPNDNPSGTPNSEVVVKEYNFGGTNIVRSNDPSIAKAHESYLNAQIGLTKANQTIANSKKTETTKPIEANQNPNKIDNSEIAKLQATIDTLNASMVSVTARNTNSDYNELIAKEEIRLEKEFPTQFKVAGKAFVEALKNAKPEYIAQAVKNKDLTKDFKFVYGEMSFNQSSQPAV